MILQKYIAQNSVFSRRNATDLILNQRVKVNNKIALPGQSYNEGDIVKIDGQIISPKNSEMVYLKLNKPKGYVCTNKNFDGEENIFKLIDNNKVDASTFFVVGRLDKESRGLVIVTNDGDFAFKYTHPKFEVSKKYIVKISLTRDLDIKAVDDIIKQLKNGMDIGENDGLAFVKDAIYKGSNVFEIYLTQGKKRQIRRMFRLLGIRVNDIFRTQIGEIKVDGLTEGSYEFFEH